ncbi:MAG: polysaccharide pyruvyl transferase family protein [Verrucomicrobiota bacterium]
MSKNSDPSSGKNPTLSAASGSSVPSLEAIVGQRPKAETVHKSFHTSLRQSTGKPPVRKLSQLAVFSKGNAGDHLLPITLRDLFDMAGGQNEWHLRNVRPLFGPDDVTTINRSAGTVIGGGGLFLRDTNENLNSGWQWNCPIDLLQAIKVPMVVFAVGYNRFRDQPEFEPIFWEHLAVLAEKSTYIGLRNQGSINAVKQYLPEKLREKVRFQPCMTTLVNRLYPHLTKRSVNLDKPVVSINMAFDRAELRYGEKELEILHAVSRAMTVLSKVARIDLVLQGGDDGFIMPFMRHEKVPFNKVDLRKATPGEIVRYYSSVDLALGMRGHAQMIPFGCGTPILSLITHDKMAWFLDDIGQPDWGIELKSNSLENKLVEKCQELLDTRNQIMEQIHQIQEDLWAVSAKNVLDATAAFGSAK